MYTYEELNALTKAQLIELAIENDIEGLSEKDLKEDIIQAILGAV